MTKRPLVPKSKSELDKMKMEVANELGLQPESKNNKPYLENLTSKEAGKMAGFKSVGNVGGEMVRRMIEQSEKELLEQEKNKT